MNYKIDPDSTFTEDTLEAIEELEEDNLDSADTIEELMADLNDMSPDDQAFIKRQLLFQSPVNIKIIDEIKFEFRDGYFVTEWDK